MDKMPHGCQKQDGGGSRNFILSPQKNQNYFLKLLLRASDKTFFTLGQKLFLSENSDLLIFTISVKFEDRKNLKSGPHWLGAGSKFDQDEKLN